VGADHQEIGRVRRLILRSKGARSVRKPAELFFPVSGALSKTPPETWRQYAPIFREHSTAVMTPGLLAALAQVEGAGNPLAITASQARSPARESPPPHFSKSRTWLRSSTFVARQWATPTPGVASG
jgi:hypothetical protein